MLLTASGMRHGMHHPRARRLGPAGAVFDLLSRFGMVLALTALALTAMAGAALAQSVVQALERRVTPQIVQTFFPSADRLGEVEESPALIRVYEGEEQIGYLFSTYDVVRAPSYSPQPFDAIVGMDMSGRLTGARLLSFHDPYLTGFPARVARLAEFLTAHVGYGVEATATAPLTPDYVQGTTISARAIRAGILNAGRVVLRADDPRPVVTEPTLDTHTMSWLSWAEMTEMGAYSMRSVTFGDLRTIFAERGIVPAAMDVPLEANRGDDVDYVQLYVSLVTPSLIGRNFVSPTSYTDYIETAPDDVVMLAIASRGFYTYRGVKYLREAEGYTFDRVRLVQGELNLSFHRNQFTRAAPNFRSDGGPTLYETGLFAIPLDTGFDPFAPFEIVLMINVTDPGGRVHTLEFPVSHQVPDEAVLLPYVEPPPAWVEAWQDAWLELSILGVALTVLTGIFVFQARLARSRQLHRWVRNGFLAFTLVWLGWIAGGQLSIVHIINYLKAPFDGADLGFYLAEPLIVVIALYVLVSLFLVGRGVFCGWLCPFGALQELTSRVARLLRLPVWNPSEKAQRLMWLPKYGILAIIVFTAFVVPEMLATVEEVEPFKTAITSVFTRPWPYVAYALSLVFINLFTERFFCRFMCPLGAVLAIGDRLHIFTHLKRRPECGTSCHLCERSCPVRAIERSGKIVMRECFQCLDCQVEYYDDRRCPPLARVRKQKARAAAGASKHQPLTVTLKGATPPASA